jgi:cobalamin-dependent methionine synthase I
VDIILSNNGYKVVNLGIKQPVENIIQAYREHNADCIAMSGLLVKSTAFMKDNLATFNEAGITVPVILGGAALTPKFVHEDCQKTYKGRVVYGKDAFADLHFMDKLMPAKAADNWDDLKGFLDEAVEEIQNAKLEMQNSEAVETVAEDPSPHPPIPPSTQDTTRSEAVDIDIPRPTPPFWGTKILNPEDISLEEVFWHLDLQALFVGQWQFRKPKEQSREEYDAFLQETVHPILDTWKGRIQAENLLHPQIVYGYFPCLAEGNSLHIYDPSVVSAGERGSGGAGEPLPEPIATFTFPRQKSLRRLCIADFFLPQDQAQPGQFDVFPMQAVTVGKWRRNLPRSFSKQISTPTTSTTTVCRCRRRKRWRNGAMPAFAASWATATQNPTRFEPCCNSATRAPATALATPPAPTSPTNMCRWICCRLIASVCTWMKANSSILSSPPPPSSLTTPPPNTSAPRARHQSPIKALLGNHCRARSSDIARGCSRCTTRILAVIDGSP